MEWPEWVGRSHNADFASRTWSSSIIVQQSQMPRGNKPDTCANLPVDLCYYKATLTLPPKAQPYGATRIRASMIKSASHV
jgi:hypothetical protein